MTAQAEKGSAGQKQRYAGYTPNEMRKRLNRRYRAELNPKPPDGNSDPREGLVGALQVGIGEKNLAEGFISYQL